MTSQQLIERFRHAAGVLLEQVPHVCRALGESAEDLEQRAGWRALRERHAVWAARTGEPVLVCVIYGPTGAGKSTFFRMLTGCSVPAGGNIRPMSHVGCVAVPGRLVDRGEDLATLFPENRLRRLEHPQQLRDRHCPADVLYWMPYLRPALAAASASADAGERPAAPAEGHATLPPVIADVPDFNSVEHANWDKAARMLDRAEAVLFLTYDESYKNRDTVEHLEHCCRRAGFLAFVLTKSTPEVAREKWADLLDHVSTSRAFAARRHDGKTLHAFLAASPAYASPRAAPGQEPELDDVASLSGDDPPLRSLLHGLDQQRIVRAGLIQPAVEAAALVRALLERAEHHRIALQQRLDVLEAMTADQAQHLATNIFPLGEFLKVFLEAVRRQQGRVQRAVTHTVGWLYGLARQGTRMLGRLRRDADAVRPHEQVERERLREAADGLFQRFRSAVPEEAHADGLLSEQRFEAIREQFVRQPPPEVGRQWHETVQQEAAAWTRANRVKARVLPTLLDTVTALSAAGLAIDFFVAGGLGTLTAAGLVASGSTALGVFGRFLNHFGLEHAFNRTAERWRRQRADELAAHLMTHLVDPLCARAWRDQVAALDEAPVASCRAACDDLRQLAGEKEGQDGA